MPPAFADDSGRTLSDIMRDYDTDKAEAAKQEAKSHRKQAGIKKDQAKEYRELADNARQYAKETSNPEDKASWLKDAVKRDKKADALEKEAREYLDKADALEKNSKDLKEKVATDLAKETAEQEALDAKVAELTEERRAEEAKKRNEDTCQLTQANELIGLWHYDDDTDSNPLAIVQEDPEVGAYPNRLELHNHKRVWKGTFDSTPDLAKDKPRMTFKYSPKVEEVNEKLPDWVAAILEGQLEWEMEIWADCDDGIVMPHALFYPGEIEWDEDSQTYEIIGRGEPRRFDLNPETHLTLDTYATAAIGVAIDKSQDPFLHPIEALTKRQRFNIVVRLPADMAEEVGKTLEVTLTGLDNDDEDTITLKRGRINANNPALYTHGKAVTIADSTDWRENPRRQKFMSLNYIFGDAGDRLDLDVETGEMVQIAYQDLRFDVPVYQSLYQRGNARFKQAANRMRAFLTMVLSGDYTQEQKEAAHLKLRMLLNYEKIISSEHANDRHRYNLGELYFGNGTANSGGLLQASQKSIEAAYIHPSEAMMETSEDPINPLMKAALEGMTGKNMDIKSNKAADKIMWTSKTEEQKVLKSLRKTSIDSRKEIMEVIYKDFSFGMYQGITSATGTDSVYLVATGKDAFGRKVPTWQRVQAAIGLSSGAVLSITGANAVRHFASKPQTGRMAISHASKETLRSAKGGKVRSTKGIEQPHGPKTLKPSQRKQTSTSVTNERAPESSKGSTKSGEGVDDGLMPEGISPVRRVEEGIEKLFDYSPLSPNNKRVTRENIQRAGKRWVEKEYPDGTKIVKDEVNSMDSQSVGLKNCQGKVLTRIIKRKTGNEVTELDMHRLITYLSELEPERLTVSGRGLIRGYKDWMIAKTARAFGLKVGEIKVSSGVVKSSTGNISPNASFRLRDLQPILKSGGGIKASLQMKRGGKHAVSIEKIKLNWRGYAKYVEVYDSNVPGVVRLSAKDFQKMLTNNVELMVFQ